MAENENALFYSGPRIFDIHFCMPKKVYLVFVRFGDFDTLLACKLFASLLACKMFASLLPHFCLVRLGPRLGPTITIKAAGGRQGCPLPTENENTLFYSGPRIFDIHFSMPKKVYLVFVRFGDFDTLLACKLFASLLACKLFASLLPCKLFASLLPCKHV